jgi:hypothetical protein
MRGQQIPPRESGEPVAGGLLDATRAVRAATSRDETVDQILDRNVVELLQELRIAFTGVQILVACLLSPPSPGASRSWTGSIATHRRSGGSPTAMAWATQIRTGGSIASPVRSATGIHAASLVPCWSP